MKQTARILAAAILFAATAIGADGASAGALEDGVTAYHEKDYAKAVELWKPLAESGVAAAQYQLGTLYAEGKGVQQSDTVAASWFHRAADQGEPAAQYNLAVSYAEGLGVAKDDATAAKWFRRAAEQGMPYAQLNLGFMYAMHRGVPEDNVEAVKWLELAIFAMPPGGARSDAAAALKGVADKMTEKEITEARAKQRAFRPKPETKDAKAAK